MSAKLRKMVSSPEDLLSADGIDPLDAKDVLNCILGRAAATTVLLQTHLEEASNGGSRCADHVLREIIWSV